MGAVRILAAFQENLLAAFAAMWAQKLRSFLTLIGIVAGVAAVILMVSFVAGFNNQVASAFTVFGTTQVTFQRFDPRFDEELPEDQRNRPPLTLDDAAALKQRASLAAAVSPQVFLDLSPKVRNGRSEARNPSVLGVGSEWAVAASWGIETGRFFTESDVLHGASVAVIGADLADGLFPHRNPLGREFLIDGRSFLVVGLFEKKGSVFGESLDNILAIPVTTFLNLYPHVKTSPYNLFQVITIPRRPEDVERLVEQGTVVLRASRQLRPNQPNNFGIETSSGGLETFRKITGGVASAMIVIAGISLLVGGVGVMNIMLVNVTERTREIGIRKAIGASDQDIAIQFLAEAVFLTGFGGVIGIGIGFGIALLVKLALKFPVATPIWAVLVGFGVSSAVGLIFGLWPALRAARLEPVVSLRYE